MSILFSCHGGMGSTFLHRRLRQLGYFVHLRPFIAFMPSDWPSRLTRLQRLTEDGYDGLPTELAAQIVKRRCRFQLDMTRSIEHNLNDYLRHIRHRSKLAVIFSRPSTMLFFSRNGIKRVNFIIRHPLHSYVSYTKRVRHYEVVAGLGGPDTEAGVEFWAREWNNTVQDALDSGNKIIRFEFTHSDTRDDAELRRIFTSWDTTKRNHGVLSSAREKQLMDLVHDNYSRLYDRWNV